ncbi:MAG TPA: NADH-quinone oxidoreductase subunit M [Mycobacteriales bacterium]|nr:NADH-quinone oxidoreductase subunit M [Mycobacteriales bacterium]
MLAAVIGLYVVSADQLGTGTFSFEALTQLEMSTGVQIALFSGFFIAFAIKAPLFPFHTWLPDAGAEAPVGGAVLLVGILDKVGTFGFLRYCLPLFPEASRILGPYVIVLCVIGILYGALLAMGQRDLKRLVSYTSVAHFGFIGLGVFAATDVFLFYVFFEAMLIPMYFLIGSYGGPRRQYAAVKFLLFSLTGGLLMLAAVIGLYVVSADQLGTGTFSFEALTQLEMSTGVQIALFSGFFIAFAIKAPLFPFHTWLPSAGAEAPVGSAVLLVGVLDKVGTFGFLRYCIPLFPAAAQDAAPWVIALCVIGVLYGALLAMGQTDMKRLVSYTSVSHFGFIGLGCFAFTSQAQTGAVLYMVNHGLSTGALFLVVGFLIARGRSRTIGDYGGVGQVAPLLAGTFFVAGLSALALPGLSTFVSEFLVLLGTFPTYPVASVLATIGIILAALYVLLMFQRTMQGPLRLPAGVEAPEGFQPYDAHGHGGVHEGAVEESSGRGTGVPGGTASAEGEQLDPDARGGTATAVRTQPARTSRVRDLQGREVLAVAPLIALMLVLGFYPKPLTDVITPAVDATLQDAGRTDPAPTQGTGEPRGEG